MDQAVKEIGLPMIAKPDNGVGAAATFKLETEDDINHFKAEWDHSTVYFFEKFVTSSEICTFDGLVDKDGKIVFSTTFDYAYTPLDLMMYKMDNSYYVLKDMDPKLRKYGEAIVKEFGMKERFFHIEFFREGTITLLLSTITVPQVVLQLMFITLLLFGPLSWLCSYCCGRRVSCIRVCPSVLFGYFSPCKCSLCLFWRRIYLPNTVSSSKLKNHASSLRWNFKGDYLYMLTTPSRQEMEQMIADFGQRQE